MKMWSRARIHLGLSESEFWRLTARQLQGLYRAHEDLLSHAEYCTGLIASISVNFSMAGVKEQLQPADFFATRWARKQRNLRTGKWREAVAAVVRSRMESMFQESQKHKGVSDPVFRLDRHPATKE